MQNYKENIVLVLDLDDTLYKEADYVLSGIKHIASLIKHIRNIDITDKLLDFHHNQPKGDFLDFTCNIIDLPASVKESLLWAYRTHFPDIHLDRVVQAWLTKSKREYHAIAILTDGRSITQRLKLAALGLSGIPVYISEEWNSEKPNNKRFIAVQKYWKDKNYVYIGDNLNKDFIAPQALNWITIGLRNNGRNIHSQATTNSSSQPKYWVKHLAEIDLLLAPL